MYEYMGKNTHAWVDCDTYIFHSNIIIVDVHGVNMCKQSDFNTFL